MLLGKTVASIVLVGGTSDSLTVHVNIVLSLGQYTRQAKLPTTIMNNSTNNMATVLTTVLTSTVAPLVLVAGVSHTQLTH